MISRNQLKTVVESALVRIAAVGSWTRGRALVLAYHNVVLDRDAGFGDASLHLPWTLFLQHIDVLASEALVLPLSEAMEPSPTPRRPRIAITFDDAYVGAIDLAIPELERRGLPCTIFVAPGLLGSPCFWWDEYARHGTGLPPRFREAALHEHAGMTAHIRAKYSAPDKDRPLPPSYQCAGEGRLDALAGSRFVSIGAHSWSHPNLTALDQQELALEVLKARDWVRGNFRNHVDALAYPYGLCSPAVELATAAAGYQAGLLVDGGWMEVTGLNRWTVPRFNVPAGLSANGLRLRLSGMLGS